MSQEKGLKIRRALLSVSDKKGIEQLAEALKNTGTEIVATGRTAEVIKSSGIEITPIEKISGSPEAFQGRMKTLSFKVCSGILYRRGDDQDANDLEKLGVKPIDCVVVNFYPFEQAAKKYDPSSHRYELIEQIDIGGPTLVRSAAKNAPDVLVLTDPSQYPEVIEQLNEKSEVTSELAIRCSNQAWRKISDYDQAIESKLANNSVNLRYGENPHQSARLEAKDDSPIHWPRNKQDSLTPTEISYNNILDFSAAYELCAELVEAFPNHSHAVIVKHNNPCGVASVLKSDTHSQITALKRAWEGDPISAFGGVICLSEELDTQTSDYLSERFIELIGTPGLNKDHAGLQTILSKRKKLKAVCVNRFEVKAEEKKISVPGGVLIQDADVNLTAETYSHPTKEKLESSDMSLVTFGILLTRSLKSNAIGLVRAIDSGFQLVGAGQGQPNRVEALSALALPRAKSCLESSEVKGELSECVLISDAFFPFPDVVEISSEAGIRKIVQPGGSIKDKSVIQACDDRKVAMVLTGVRHFRH